MEKNNNHCIYEEFPSITKLLKILDSRTNNTIMQGQFSSSKEDYNFTKTHNYEEAVSLLRFGYTDVLDQIKKEVKRNNKLIYQGYVNKRKIQNMPIGFIPNVPNAIQNRPDSMINITAPLQKRKTLSIIYAMSGSAFEDADTFIKAGAALVSAINLIELSGVQTRLYVNFMPAYASGNNGIELLSPVLRIKNYGERFNLTKICFPLVHPSMFRRIGFKYLETCPFVTQSGFRNGYGTPPSLKILRENIPTDNQTFILNTTFIKENDYNISNILKELQKK